MERLSLTAFGRQPVTASLIDRARAAKAPAPVARIDKWSLFRDLTTARAAFGVTDRDLTVLNALISFHRPTELTDDGPIIVYPSNRVLMERAHGMAESTLRRHLAALVAAGLIARRDSPNGKRYPNRRAQTAYGFDLRPLLVSAEDIVTAADEVRQSAEALRQAQATLTLLIRDAVKLLHYGQSQHPDAPWSQIDAEIRDIQRTKRRKLTASMAKDACARAETLLARIESILETDRQTENQSARDSQNGRHHQKSQKDIPESEMQVEDATHLAQDQMATTEKTRENEAPSVGTVQAACPDILLYGQGPMRGPEDLVRTADFVRGMMGISETAWLDAKTVMGPYDAAVTISAMLQRITSIKSPGGYLRALTSKAREAAFSPAPMITALAKHSHGIGVS